MNLEIMSVLIELDNVSKLLEAKLIIDQVSFKLHKGDLTTLIGPNGAGKTTIAKLITGLESPSSGNIIILPNLRIGYVPQKLEINKNLPLTVEHFVYLLVANFEYDKWQWLLDFADFNRLRNLDVSKLSGGQLQKILLVATLLNNPDLVILDEPTQSLDINSQQEFYRLLDKIRKETQLTIFMISHDLYTVMKNSDQVICLNGHICCSGRPSDSTHDQDFISALSTIGFYTHHHDHRH